MKKIFVTIMGLYLMLVFFSGSSLAAEKIAEISASLESNIKQSDPRVEKLESFLKEYESPLTSKANVFVEIADKYSLDWRLVTAIAGVESTFAKRIPQNSYNAWGFGIPTGSQTGLSFNTWEEGIETVSQTLKEKYLDRGLNTVSKISPVYAPPSKSWASNVLYFMEKIESTAPRPELSL